jgi:hypothetical protein
MHADFGADESGRTGDEEGFRHGRKRRDLSLKGGRVNAEDWKAK